MFSTTEIILVIHTFDIFNIYTGQYGFCSATSSAFPATWPGWCCCRRSTSPAPASTTGSRRWCSAGCCPWWPAGAGPPATTLSRVEIVLTLWVGTNFSYFLITRYTHDKLEPWIKTMISEHGGCPTAYVHLRVKTESHKQSHVDHGQGLQVYQLWCRLVDSWWLFHQVCVCVKIYYRSAAWQARVPQIIPFIAFFKDPEKLGEK